MGRTGSATVSQGLPLNRRHCGRSARRSANRNAWRAAPPAQEFSFQAHLSPSYTRSSRRCSLPDAVRGNAVRKAMATGTL